MVFQSNEDHTKKISQSIYVTNFPDSTNSGDLWKVCSAYGTVIDVFIPNKKAKSGKRFAFVRFIKVPNLVRLVENLCTIWIGRHHLYANQVRFERPHPNFPPLKKAYGASPLNPNSSGFSQPKRRAGSYASMVNGASLVVNGNSISPSPALVLDDSCIVDRDLSKHAMGCLKDINSFSNLKTILSDESFPDINLLYLGGMWVLLEFDMEETKVKLMQHTGVNSWFQLIRDAESDFVCDERIVWVDIEGVPLHAWSRETFMKIGKKWGEVVDLEENGDSSFGRKRLCIKTKHAVSILEAFKIIVKGKVFMIRAKELFLWNPTFLPHKERLLSSDDESEQFKTVQPCSRDDVSIGEGISDDEEIPETIFDDNLSSPKHCGETGNSPSPNPFKIYDLLKKKSAELLRESSPSLSHPPGFTSDCAAPSKVIGDTSGGSSSKSARSSFNAKVMTSSQKVQEEADSVCSAPKAVKKGGGSVLEGMEEMIRVGQVMGYSMDGCINDLVNIIGNQGDKNETKMSGISHMDVKFMWGNSNYDFVFSESLAIYGTWIPTNSKILFVAVYAPQAVLCKRSLWDYIMLLIGRWKGESIVMGDFNEMVGFDDMVEQTWRSFSHTDVNKMVRFKKKLQDLKSIIRAWVKDKRISISGSKVSIKNELHDIDKELDNGVVSDSSLLRRLELNRQLSDIKVSEAKDFFQKSKVKWAVEGDENSKFFHGLINKKRSRNLLDLDSISHLGKNFQAAHLDDLVSRDEIKLAVVSTLSLALAHRLAAVLPELISDTQSAFVAGRQIFDGPFILNEILHWCKRKNKQAMFFKVDFAKAYDSVRWDYLLDMLEGFGFGPSWCKWIRGTFSSAKASVLVNGSPSNEFSFHCGLKQGDPLAPYLFILVMESLHMSFSRVVEGGYFKGEWSDQNLEGIIHILKCFHLASGLKINIHKCQLLGVGVSRLTVELVARSIGCDVLQNQFRYLVCWGERCMTRLKAWEDDVLKDKGFDFGSHCKKRLGDGHGTRFWIDVWTSDMPLCVKFPRLFALELDKDASVASKMAGPLDFSFRRSVRDGSEQQQMLELVSIVDAVSLSPSPDRWVCDLYRDGNIGLRRGLHPNLEVIWSSGVSFSFSSCPLCDSSEEDTHHVLFRCSLAQAILRRVCRWWDLEWHPWISFLDWQVWLFYSCFGIVKSLLKSFLLVGVDLDLLRISYIFDDIPLLDDLRSL
ncbi:RNA-directed DNA polymerase, eukaryota [Tanacetum coccineum]|uniref:RNA-directed DNA polymerase, eukaryota n=1 Tax=Tanacetum coccineum TaxID=301880 RepID=A0ABQ4ZWI6_9ASTR